MKYHCFLHHESKKYEEKKEQKERFKKSNQGDSVPWNKPYEKKRVSQIIKLDDRATPWPNLKGKTKVISPVYCGLLSFFGVL